MLAPSFKLPNQSDTDTDAQRTDAHPHRNALRHLPSSRQILLHGPLPPSLRHPSQPPSNHLVRPSHHLGLGLDDRPEILPSLLAHRL